MGRVIPLFGDPHEKAELLLPWYLTGRLDAAERQAVDAHLATCAECRATLESERALRAGLQADELGVEPGWAALQARLRGAPPARAGLMRRMMPRTGTAMLIAAQFGLVAVLVSFSGAFDRPAPYQALGEAAAPAGAQAIVKFRPELTERELRRALKASDARLVDGPTEADAYVVRLAPGAEAAGLAALRREAGVVMAEPIGDGG